MSFPRARRFLRRHPGVKQSIRRVAGVAALTGGVLLAAHHQKTLSRRTLAELRQLTVSRDMMSGVRSVRSAGFHALGNSIRKRRFAAIGKAYRHRARADRALVAAGAVGSVGATWASIPGFEAHADHRDRKRAIKTVHRTKGYIRSKGITRRVVG